MPRIKARLTTSDWLRYSSCWEKLRAEGIELGPEAEERTVEPSRLVISAKAGPGEVFDVDNYRTGYAVRVHLCASSRVFIDNCVLRTEWHPELEPEYFKEPRYRLGLCTYHPKEVLNQKFDDGPWAIQRGIPIEGVILAYGEGLLPPEITRGIVDVQVTITDTLGQQSSGTVPVFVERAVKQKAGPTVERKAADVGAGAEQAMTKKS